LCFDFLEDLVVSIDRIVEAKRLRYWIGSRCASWWSMSRCVVENRGVVRAVFAMLCGNVAAGLKGYMSGLTMIFCDVVPMRCRFNS
jgi:hypothetical protein